MPHRSGLQRVGVEPPQGTLAWRLYALFQANRRAPEEPGKLGETYTFTEVADAINKQYNIEQRNTLRDQMVAAGNSEEEIERALAERDEESAVTAAYIGSLVNGSRKNPGALILGWLAWFFGVTIEDLVPVTAEQEARAQEADQQLKDLLAIQRLMAEQDGMLALFRHAASLTPENFRTALTTVAGLHALQQDQGAPDVGDLL